MSSETSAPPLRERKRLATREKLLDTAVGLFGARGYPATTMDDIAEAADVSRATAFNYFPRKEEFLLGWVERRRSVLVALLARDQDEGVNTITRLEHAFMTLADRLEADSDTNRSLVRAFIQAGVLLLPGATATADVFADTIRFGQAHGDVRNDVDADSVGQVLLGAYIAALLFWATADGTSPDAGPSASLRRQLETVVALLAPALHPDRNAPRKASAGRTRRPATRK